MIRFHILGAGGAVPTPTHTPAAYWVVVDGQSLLLDPGPGALVRLVKSGEAPRGVDEIDTVLLTHLHPDHCADLVPLLFALHSPVPESTTPLAVFGPRGLAAFLDHMRTLYGSWLEPRKRKLQVREIEPGAEISLSGGGGVAAFAVAHPQDRLSADCLGYRFLDSEGRSVVFSGDTEACAGLTTAAAGADLLVLECSVPDELATPGHMSTAQAAGVCAAARPARVVLTHQYPPAAALDLAALVGAKFDGPVYQARDGDVFTVPEPRE